MQLLTGCKVGTLNWNLFLVLYDSFHPYLLLLNNPFSAFRHGLCRSEEEEQFCRKDSFGCYPYSIMHCNAEEIPIFQHPKPGKSMLVYDINICLFNHRNTLFLERAMLVKLICPGAWLQKLLLLFLCNVSHDTMTI